MKKINLLYTVAVTALCAGTMLSTSAWAQVLAGEGSNNVWEQIGKEKEGEPKDWTGSSEDEDDADYGNEESDSGQTTTTTTTDGHGVTTTTTTTGEGSPETSGKTGGTSSGTGTSSGSGSSASGDKKSDAKKPEEKKKEAKVYTGVFNKRQIIPNSMAIYCETNAEDMLKESKKLYDCINKIAKKINDKDSSIRAENLQRYNEIRYEQLKILMADAVAKGATIANYENIQNEIGKATGETRTEHEDNAAIANTVSTLTDVINTMRDLYAERLKSEAITGINSIDTKVITDLIKDDEDMKAAEEKDNGKSGKKGLETSSTSVVLDTTNPKLSAFKWVSGNQCTRTVCSDANTCAEETTTCPNNIYSTDDPNIKVICADEKCQQFNELDVCTSDILSEQSGLTSPSEAKCGSGTCEAGIYTLNGIKYACYNGECINCSAEVTITATKK